MEGGYLGPKPGPGISHALVVLDEFSEGHTGIVDRDRKGKAENSEIASRPGHGYRDATSTDEVV